MNLPADLSEGWWWVRWEDGGSWIVDIVRRDGRFGVLRPNGIRSLDEFLPRWSAMERVAAPSWERGDAE